MAEIFISYSQQDRTRVEPLVEALSKEGWEVWWDLNVRAGERFDRAIERTLEQVNAIVAVWTESSVESDWVRSEAAWALEHKNLLTVRFEGDFSLPLQFSHVHAHDMTHWKGSQDDPRYHKLVGDIVSISGAPTPDTGSDQASNENTKTDGVKPEYKGTLDSKPVDLNVGWFRTVASMLIGGVIILSFALPLAVFLQPPINSVVLTLAFVMGIYWGNTRLKYRMGGAVKIYSGFLATLIVIIVVLAIVVGSIQSTFPGLFTSSDSSGSVDCSMMPTFVPC